MNGRVYDPLLARFMSADPNVQAPGNGQSFNRYSYVFNNPLSATDPSGYLRLFGHEIRIFNNPTVRAITAVVASYYTFGALQGAFLPFGDLAAYAASGAVAGGISGGTLKSAVTGGITGGIFGSVAYLSSPGEFNLNSYQKIGANAVTGGVTTEMLGGKFQDGFRNSFFTASSSEAYRYVTTYTPDPLPGKALPSGAYDESLGVVPRGYAVFGDNEPVTGNFFNDFTKQGGFLGKLANAIPIADSGAAFHDSLFVREIFGLTKSAWTNVPTMLPAGIVTIGANLDGPLIVQLSLTGNRR